MSRSQLPLTIEPLVSYPREAEAGRTYLMTVDLRFPVDRETWPYDEEEHEIYCLLDSAPFFDNEEINDGVLVLHRFGGTYGPAMFLLTAKQLDMDGPTGVIKLTLANRRLMPLQVLKLDNIRISRKAAAPGSMVNVTRRQFVPTESSADQPAPVQESMNSAATDATGPDAPSLEEMALPTGVRLLRQFHLSSAIRDAAWSPDGRQLALSTGGSLFLFDDDAVSLSRQLRALENPHEEALPACLAWSAAGQLAVAYTRTIVIFDPDTGRRTHQLSRFDADIADIQWTPAGDQLGVAKRNGQMDIVIADSNETAASFSGRGGPASCLAWRRQGDYFLVGFDSGAVGLWSSRRSARMRHGPRPKQSDASEEETGWASGPRVYDGHKARVNCVAWSPRGLYFVSGSDDRTIRLWRVDEPADNYQITLEGHTGGITRLSFSANGELLASKSDDGTVRIWRIPERECIAVLPLNNSQPNAVLSFRPTGSVLAVGVLNNTVATLELDIAALQAPAAPPEMNTGISLGVVICYSSDAEPDGMLASAIVKDFHERFNVGIHDASAGQWTNEQFERAENVIVLLSGVSAHSEVLAAQVERAHKRRMESGRPRILPVRVSYHEPLPRPLNGYLDPIQWAYWENPSDTPRLIEDLVRSISRPDSPEVKTGSDSPQEGTPIFFAYKRNVEPDESTTREIAEALGHRHPVFIDHRMPIGVKWAEEIEKGFAEARVLIVILTPASVRSKWVNRYIQRAAARLDSLRIIPLRLAFEGQLPRDLSFMNHLRQIVWRNPADTGRVVEEIRKIVEAPDPYHGKIPPLRGPVDPDSKFYIERYPLGPMIERLRSGRTIAIRGPRQTGKTSLLLRIDRACREKGKKTILLNFAPLADEHPTFERLVHDICEAVGEAVGQAERFRKTWPAPQTPPGSHHYTSVLQGLLTDFTVPLVLLLDGLEWVWEGEPDYSRFMETLLDWTNSLNDLSVVLTTGRGSKSIFLKHLSFEAVVLNDFALEETAQLNQLHGAPINSTEERRLHELLNGHPLLTQRALFVMASGRCSMEALLAGASDLNGPFSEHLNQIYARLLDNESAKWDLRFRALQLTGSGPPRTIEPEALERLEKLGILQLHEQGATLRCKLYDEFLFRHIAT